MSIKKPSSVTIVSISVGSEYYGLGDDQKLYKYVHIYDREHGPQFDDHVAAWVEVKL